jgi:ABC-2 type transport system ATP-binding protein
VDPPRPAAAVAAELQASVAALTAELARDTREKEARAGRTSVAADVDEISTIDAAAAETTSDEADDVVDTDIVEEADAAKADAEDAEDADVAEDAGTAEVADFVEDADVEELELARSEDATGEPLDAADADAPVTASAPRFGGPRGKRRPVRVTAPDSPAAEPAGVDVALSVEGLTKYFGSSPAVDGIDLEVAPGSFFGIVGPNGAGKTTTLSMVTGLLRPDKGVVRVFGLDVWNNPAIAKRHIGVLPDRLRLFDRLTGAEFLYHAGALRGLDRPTIAQRSADLAAAFGLEHSLHRLVSDYSAGMTKKIAIAAAMIHAPRLLVLDEPFESVDPVSVSVVVGVLKRFTAAGGTVILSSHSMELTERVCDSIAIIAGGVVLAEGSLGEVLEGRSLEERFVELAGGEAAVEGMEWLQNFSD